jgi:hypothetical protein
MRSLRRKLVNHTIKDAMKDSPLRIKGIVTQRDEERLEALPVRVVLTTKAIYQGGSRGAPMS